MDKNEIRDLRIRLNMSQQQFAVKVGVSITTVASWESGKYSPSPLAMEKLNQIKKEIEENAETPR